MSFIIQAGAPRSLIKYDREDLNLSEAIETVFPLYCEAAILNWNGVYVPIGYKYDLSEMIDDLVDLIEGLCKSDVENHGKTVNWCSNTFKSQWDIAVKGNRLEVVALWESVVGNTESILAMNRSLDVTIIDFINEWKKVFSNIISGLSGAGYEPERLDGFMRLMKLESEIPSFGKLYVDEHR